MKSVCMRLCMQVITPSHGGPADEAEIEHVLGISTCVSCLPGTQGLAVKVEQSALEVEAGAVNSNGTRRQLTSIAFVM